ncbi:MAG TPA: nucleotidyltransferase family protein [Candidatus Thermoplasmatota archaeon]|nr:nucleotidyltransferase family protein [Candidatus Thermoplasmatota archaeon]
MAEPRIRIPKGELAGFCRRNRIRELSLFGSVLRSDFRPESDVDVLVEFEEGHGPGLLGLVAMERELSSLIGRRVDLNTKGFLSPYFVAEVLKEAQAQYVAA